MSERRARQSLNYRAEQAGLLVAGAAAPLGFQRTLMPRKTADQALISGLSLATNHALATLVQESIQSLALLFLGQEARRRIDEDQWSRTTLAVDVVAVGAGLALQRAFSQTPDEPLSRAGVRTGGYWLTTSATAGTMIGVLQETVGRYSNRRALVPAVVPATAVLAGVAEVRRRRAERLNEGMEPEPVQAASAKSLAMALGVAATTSGIGALERVLANTFSNAAARVLPGNAAFWRPVGHVASLAALGFGTRALAQQMLHRIEKTQESVEAALDIPPPVPYVSGSLASEVPFETIARSGRRYVWTVSTPDKIEEVVGEPAKHAPIRAYVGLGSAETIEERVALAMRELDRTGAFDRAYLMFASPTGTGYINYAAVTALEMLTRGDCATVALQYAARPSPLSLDRVKEGRRQARAVIKAIGDRLASLPAERRPKFVLFGESLGAWTSQDAVKGLGTQGLLDAGVDYAIWIGTPYFSQWKEQVLRDEGPETDRSLIGVFNDIDELRALGPKERAALRYVMITHHDDGVALMGPTLAIQAPSWLGDPESRPAAVPKAMRWMPTTTFFQVLVDMKNAANVVPGVFEAKAHDYRADLLSFFHEVLGLDASPEQLRRIGEFLEFQELRRSRWMKAHATADKSLSATLARQWMASEVEAGRDPSEALIRAFRSLQDELDEEAEREAAATTDGPPPTSR